MRGDRSYRGSTLVCHSMAADDGGLPEGICIPRAPGRTFCSALQDRLQPTDGLSLAKGEGILFPIDALFDYWIF